MTRTLIIILALLLAGCTTPPARPSGNQVQGPQNPVCLNRSGQFEIVRTVWYAIYTPDLGSCGTGQRR